MNQFLCIIYLSSLIACGSGEDKKIISENQSLQPRFDIRIELISIVSRLASYDEYNMPNATNYINRIHDHYDHYKDHELIQFAKKLRIETGMGFDGPMLLAVHLKYSDDKFYLIEYTQNNLDSRWSQKTAKKYVHLLNDFYIKSKSSTFFKENQEYYNKGIQSFKTAMIGFDQKWYTTFYGTQPLENFNVIIGFSNGRANYGVRALPVNELLDVYAIIGSSQFDSSGYPTFNSNNVEQLLTHEFNHSFVNPLLDKNINNEQFIKSAKKLFEITSEQMQKNAYASWQPLVNETIVRACAIEYLKDHQTSQIAIDSAINKEIEKSFLWMPAFVELISEYNSNRKKYPTLESFYPNLIQGFVDASNNIPALLKVQETVK